MTREELIKYINENTFLEGDSKSDYLSMLNEEGVDDSKILDVLNLIEDEIQGKIDAKFKEAGIELDENDPEYKAKHAEMMNEMQAAEDEFNVEMGKIDKEVSEVQKEASQQLDDIKAQAVRASME